MARKVISLSGLDKRGRRRLFTSFYTLYIMIVAIAISVWVVLRKFTA